MWFVHYVSFDNMPVQFTDEMLEALELQIEAISYVQLLEEMAKKDLVAECQHMGVAGMAISELTKGLDKLRSKRNELTTSVDQNMHACKR